MLSYDELREKFIGILDLKGIPHTWHSFVQLPSAHCFGSYCVKKADFDGADDYAMYRHDTINLCLFYRGGMTAEDFLLEEDLEDAVREAENYSKTSDYDSSNGLFYSVYTFRCDMRL